MNAGCTFGVHGMGGGDTTAHRKLSFQSPQSCIAHNSRHCEDWKNQCRRPAVVADLRSALDLHRRLRQPAISRCATDVLLEALSPSLSRSSPAWSPLSTASVLQLRSVDVRRTPWSFICSVWTLLWSSWLPWLFNEVHTAVFAVKCTARSPLLLRLHSSSRKAGLKSCSCDPEGTRKGKMINRLSYIPVTAAFLIVAFTQTQAQTSEVCSGIDCQQGTCVPLRNNSYPSNILSPYQCTCNPGWQTLEGFLTNLPHVLSLPCTIPNCTLNLGCGGTPAPPLQAPLTLEHVSSPCSLPGICGNGECVVTDLAKYPPMYKCNCQQGYANVGNLTAGYCLTNCEVGSNCHAIGISLPSKSAGSLQASVFSTFQITVAVVSASCSLPLFL